MSGQISVGPSTSSYPAVSTAKRLSRVIRRQQRTAANWKLDASTSHEGFRIVEFGDEHFESSTSTSDMLLKQQRESPRHLERLASQNSSSGRSGDEVKTARTSELRLQPPTLLENTLKLASLSVSSTPPDPSVATKVTLSDRCRPHVKVVFNQELFKARARPLSRTIATSTSNSSRNSADVTSLETSPYAQSTFTTSAAGTNTVTSPSTSSVHIALPASGSKIQDVEGKGDEAVEVTPSPSNTASPTLARRAAWTKPRSWADLASRMGPSVLQGNSAVFSENINGTSSLPQSPYQPRSQRSRAPTEEKGSRSRSIKGARRKELSVSDVMKEAESRFDAPLTYPRGMINTGNMCFANAILQVLVYCAPFYNLFRLLGEVLPHDFHNSTPLMEAVIQFLSEFKTIPDDAQHDHHNNGALAADILRDLHAISEPFVPDSMYDAMKLTKRFDAMRRGHQEDAEEFLGFFLDTLHEELQITTQKAEARLHIQGHETATEERTEAAHALEDDEGHEEETERRVVNRPASPMEGEGWLEVGQKGKTSFTRTTSAAHSPITRIFGGKLRSVLRTPGSKDSVTLEPYQPLQLDIQPAHVNTIEDALENLTRPEIISGVLSSAKKLVDATKQVFIETLPPVLIVHLKRFYYDDVGGVQKSTKSLSFGATLEIADNVISSPRRSEAKRKYNLFGVVYHHGRFANGGHYTVDVLRQDRSEWLHIDDTVWATTSAPQTRTARQTLSTATNSAAAALANAAMKPASPKVANGQLASSMGDAGSTSAYLLFYTRADATPGDGKADKVNGIAPPISAKRMAEIAAGTNKITAVPGASLTSQKPTVESNNRDFKKHDTLPSSPKGRRSKA